jgi:hypothetical protein
MGVRIIRAIHAVVLDSQVSLAPAGKRLPWFPFSDALIAEQRTQGALWLGAVVRSRCCLLSE